MLQHGTPREFANTRNRQTGSIRDEYSMDAGGTSGSDLLAGKGLFRRTWRQVADGIQRLFPSPASEHLCQDAERKGQQHPRPVHLISQHMLQPWEVFTPIHPIENSPTQEDREDHFCRICEDGLHFHGDKGTNNNWQMSTKCLFFSLFLRFFLFVCANSRTFAPSKDKKRITI